MLIPEKTYSSIAVYSLLMADKMLKNDDIEDARELISKVLALLPSDSLAIIDFEIDAMLSKRWNYEE